jgi:protein-disulfide isomerase
MKDFFSKNKVFIIVVIITVILILGGVLIFSGKSSTNIPIGKVSASLLIPQGAIETSGIVNGSYLPASSSATVTLVEFGDYECPACGEYNPIVKQALTDYVGKITYIFRNYPLAQHANAQISSDAVEAAGLQGKYWQMHDKVYDTQNDWINLSDPTSIFAGYAKDLGLNVDQFTKDLSSSTIKNIVQNDLNDGNTIGITETPTFYLNGQKMTLTGTYDQFKSLIDSALAGK